MSKKNHPLKANKPIKGGLDYHRATCYARHGIKAHHLDFERYPVPFNTYGFIKTIDFQDSGAFTGISLNEILCGSGTSGNIGTITKDALFGILKTAYGVTRVYNSGGIPFFKRTVPSAGGLYPCHLYLLIQNVKQIETGLYYCDMIHQRLVLIQEIKTLGPADHQQGAIQFIITAQIYNSAWKYRERAFRYILLDTGHLIEQLRLSLKAFGYHGVVDKDMDEKDLTSLLSLDERYEIPTAVIQAGKTQAAFVKTGQSARPENKKFDIPVYDLPGRLYEKMKNCRRSTPAKLLHAAEKTPVTWPLKSRQKIKTERSFQDAAVKRTSKRSFNDGSLCFCDLSALIHAAGISGKDPCRDDDIAPYLKIGLVCRDIDEIEDGFYWISNNPEGILLQEKGNFAPDLARVCLDQMWMEKAHVSFLFVADLECLEADMGARGYAGLMTAAGQVAQRIYLAVEMLNMGCCAVGALYDGEAADLLGLAQNQFLFYVVSAGRIL